MLRRNTRVANLDASCGALKNRNKSGSGKWSRYGFGCFCFLPLATREKLVDRKSEWNIIGETTSIVTFQRKPPPNVPVCDE